MGDLGAQESKPYCPSIHTETLTFSPIKNSSLGISSTTDWVGLDSDRGGAMWITGLVIEGDVPATTDEVVCLAAIISKNGG